ncbi:hypothetical protein [Bacillus weihaiensis]|uniref:Transporter n=1 Tax=Bacillus weihaiensis TaxID=1547283 RepID=A0A1L3MRE2_9BACI|nr:hypothetical protein [Bacillus weihaiensis]APH04920.1 hypothetical protein A9C19_09250 [Bacillus weihaiensis]
MNIEEHLGDFRIPTNQNPFISIEQKSIVPTQQVQKRFTSSSQPSTQTQIQPGAPTTPPPATIPTQMQQMQAVDPGSISRCLYKFTYIWLRGSRQIWFYPIFVGIGQQSVSGFRWDGNSWIYSLLSLRQIQSFTCNL